MMYLYCRNGFDAAGRASAGEFLVGDFWEVVPVLAELNRIGSLSQSN
jgi:hypothetical protein